MLFGFIRGLFKLGLVGAIAAGGAGTFAYWKYAASKVPAAQDGAVSGGLCRATPSLSGGALPLTFEAYPKLARAQNFLDAGGSQGLVAARYEWSHGSQAWVEDADFAARQAGDVAGRKKIAAEGFDALLKDLESTYAERREIASKELLIRTGETKGYRYDASEAERAAAVAAWQRWWADDANKMKYGAKRAVDFGQKALDVLKRALGEPQPQPQPDDRR
jgi:hypothetical protein